MATRKTKNVVKPIEEKIETVVEDVVEEEIKTDEIWKINWVPVYQGSAFIKTESYATPVPMYKLPVELQKYLRNKWFGTNVYKESKEWLEKHWADMKMIEALKRFISETFYN